MFYYYAILFSERTIFKVFFQHLTHNLENLAFYFQENSLANFQHNFTCAFFFFYRIWPAPKQDPDPKLSENSDPDPKRKKF